MALVLDRGRPRARSFYLLESVTSWFIQMRAARAQRQALAYLLELDAYRLDDLGINRADLFAAMESKTDSTAIVADRRARRFRSF